MPSWVVDDAKWTKAKEFAAKQGRGTDYAFVTGIYKRMGGKVEHNPDKKPTMKAEVDALYDLLKARDISKLQKKQITNKNGHKQTVYVRHGEAQTAHKEHGGDKAAVKDGLEQFRELALKHNLTDSFNKTTQIKGIPSSVAQAFKKKYDPKGNLTPKQTWEKFYDEVNSAAPKPGEYSSKNGVQLKVNADGSSEGKYGKYGPKGTKELIKEHGLTHQGETTEAVPGGSYHVAKTGHVTGHSPVKGEKVEVHPHLHTFIHKQKDVYAPHAGGLIKDAYVVTEASTGLRMAAAKTKEEAIAHAKSEVDRIGIEQIKQKLHSTKQRSGAMPGFEHNGEYETTQPHEAANEYKMNTEKQREATWGKLHADKQLIRGTDIKDGYKDAKAWHEQVKNNPGLWTDSVISAKRFKADFIKRGPAMANQKLSDAVYWSGVEKVAKETGTWDGPAKEQQEIAAKPAAGLTPEQQKTVSEKADKVIGQHMTRAGLYTWYHGNKKTTMPSLSDAEFQGVRAKVKEHLDEVEKRSTMKAQNPEIEGLRSLLKATPSQGRPLRKAEDAKEAAIEAVQENPKQGKGLRDCDKSFIKALGTIAAGLPQKTKDQFAGLITYDLRWCTNAQDIMNKVDAAVMFETGKEIEPAQRATLVTAANEIVKQNVADRVKDDTKKDKIMYQPTLAKAAEPDAVWMRRLQQVDRITL